MAISRNETIEKAELCTKTAIDIQQDINKIQDDLRNYQSEIKNLNNSILEKITADEITDGCSKCMNGINKKVGDTSSKMNSYLKGLAKDVNNYIDMIELEYNTDLINRKKKAKEEGKTIDEEPLKIKRIELGGNGTYSLVDELKDAGSNTGKTTPTHRNSGSSSSSGSSSGGYSSSPTSPPPTTYSQQFIDTYKVQLDYVLGRNLMVGLNSNTINNWDMFILDFIKMNGLEDSVQSIELDNGVVRCLLLSGQSHDFQDIHTFDELLEAIKNVI